VIVGRITMALIAVLFMKCVYVKEVNVDPVITGNVKIDSLRVGEPEKPLAK
jgi:hypothetical protein